MGEGKGRGPDKRVRKRRRGKIAGSAAQAEVDACLEGGGTLEEASRILKDNDGFSVSTSAMSRYARRLRAEGEALRKFEMLAGEIAERAMAPPGRDAAALARRLLLARALDAVLALPEDALEELTAERLSLLVSRLERTGAMAERARIARERLEAREREENAQPPAKTSHDRPDLIDRLLGLMRGGEIGERAEMEEKAETVEAGEKEAAAETGSPSPEQKA